MLSFFSGSIKLSAGCCIQSFNDTDHSVLKKKILMIFTNYVHGVDGDHLGHVTSTASINLGLR